MRTFNPKHSVSIVRDRVLKTSPEVFGLTSSLPGLQEFSEIINTVVDQQRATLQIDLSTDEKALKSFRHIKVKFQTEVAWQIAASIDDQGNEFVELKLNRKKLLELSKLIDVHIQDNYCVQEISIDANHSDKHYTKNILFIRSR